MQQVPYTAIPHACPPQMIPIAMSFMVLGQYLGGSVFLAISNVVFSSTLRSSLREHAPNADAARVIEAGAGATNIRKLIPDAQLEGVIEAYSVSVSHVFYLATGSAAALFVVAFFTGWIDTRPKKKPEPAGEKADNSEDKA